MELMVLRVLKDYQDRTVLMEHKVHKESKVFKANKVQ
jgi:hypothetical protein